MAAATLAAPTGWRWALWLAVAFVAHLMVALFGVLNRWLQVKPSPPLPALRLALLVTLMSLGSAAAVDVASRAVRALGAARRRRQQRPSALPQQTPRQPPADPGVAESADAVKPGEDAPATGCRISTDGSRCAPALTADATAPSPARQDSSFVCRPGVPPPPRPELALRRGLSRRVRDAGAARPRLVYYAALALTTVSFSLAFTCQVIAPGLVDPSLVQLVNMFTVIGVALVQRLLLRHRLPPAIWPAAFVMLGGAAMVIAPTIGKNQAAGLDGWRGWLGFALSLASMASTVVYFVSLQAFRRLGFTSLQLQYCYLLLCIAVLLPLSLPIDGTDWAAQFASWDASSWAVLALTSSVVCIGANYAIQHSMWHLGASTVSMFYGVRLVASIVESQLLLGYTVIRTGVQVAGAVITVAAVTAYLFLQWRDSRRAAVDAAQGAAAATARGQEAAETEPPADACVVVEPALEDSSAKAPVRSCHT